MEDHYKYKVLVSCLTYNHSAYIKDALEGFCMQKTNFPFVCLIIDDASTDGEQGVILDYLKNNFELGDNSIARSEETDDYVETYARHKTNESCYFVVLLLKKNHYSIGKPKKPYYDKWQCNVKYIATCEGDDYWIDPYKLQKQVDFLEKNPQYSLVRTNVHRFHQDKNYMEKDYFSHRKIRDTKESYLLFSYWLATCTWLFRNVLGGNNSEPKRDDVFYGDLFILLQLSQLGSVKFIEDSTAVYRILEESASHFKSWKDWFYFSWKCKNTRLLFVKKCSFLLKTKFWLIELLRINYRAVRTFDINCIWFAVKSVANDFFVLFIKK